MGESPCPLVGGIDVSDRTRSQVASLIIAALSAYYKDLTVTVSIDKYSSNRIIVLGNVLHPGVLYFDDTPTLLDVIARAGLLASTEGEPTGSPAVSAASATREFPSVARFTEETIK